MAPLCALLVNGGREEPRCLDRDGTLSLSLIAPPCFCSPRPRPAGSLKVIGLEVSPWGVVALSLSHVGSEAFFTHNKRTQWPRCAQKAIILAAGTQHHHQAFYCFSLFFCFFLKASSRKRSSDYILSGSPIVFQHHRLDEVHVKKLTHCH